MNNKELTQVQQRNASNGGTFLGSIIGWKVSNSVDLDFKTFINLANLNGVESNLLPLKTRPINAFKKAIAQAQKKAKQEGFLLRYITKEEPLMVGIVWETADGINEKLDYEYLGLISYEKGIISGKVKLPNSQLTQDKLDELLLLVEDEYFKQQKCTSSDLYELLRNFALRYSIRLTPYGGSYFVPATYQQQLKAVNQFIADCDLGKESKIFTFEMFDSPQNQSDLGEVTSSHLEDEIAELNLDLEKFLETANPDGKRFEKGLDIRQEALLALKSRVGIFGNILNFQSKLLYDKLDKIQKTLDGESCPNYVEQLETAIQEVETAGF